MNNSLQNSKIHKLIRDTTYVILHKKDRCKLKNRKQPIDKYSRMTCRCGQCLLTASILRGQKLIKVEKEYKFESLKKILTTPLILKAIALEGLSNTITVLFFSVALSFSFFSFKHFLTTKIETSQEVPLGVDITKEQIVRVVRQPSLERPRLQMPTGFKIIK